MSTEHKSKTNTTGGKNAESIFDLLGINVEVKVKGYKSSEGDKTFEPPTEQKRQP